MNEQHKYRATDKMSDLICDNYSLLMVMSRFGLSLGFGDKSVKDVCEAQHVDYRTFLAVANFISEEQYSYSADNDSFSIPALMDYLKRAHAYFLDFNLPAMRRKLIEAIDCSRDNDVAYLILKFFDEYAKEVGIPSVKDMVNADNPKKYLRPGETLADLNRQVVRKRFNGQIITVPLGLDIHN